MDKRYLHCEEENPDSCCSLGILGSFYTEDGDIISENSMDDVLKDSGNLAFLAITGRGQKDVVKELKARKFTAIAKYHGRGGVVTLWFRTKSGRKVR